MEKAPWESDASSETPPWGAPAPEDNSSDFVRGFKSYLPQTEETLGGAQILLGQAAKNVLGKGVVSDYLTQHGIANRAEANAKEEKLSKPTDSLSKAWEKGIGAVVTDWLPYQMGSGVANLLETGATMVGGAALGSVLPGVGTAGGALEGILGKTLIKKGIKDAAEGILKREGEEAAQTFIERHAIDNLVGTDMGKAFAKQGAKTLGGNAGNIAQATFHGLGEVGSRAADEAPNPDEIDLKKALPAAALHSVADYIGERIGLGNINGLSKATQTFLEKTGEGLLGGAAHVGAGVLTAGAKEIPPELLQQFAERYGANLPTADKNAIQEYIDTAGAAMGMSVLPGGVGGIRTFMGNKTTPEAPTTPQVTPPTNPPEPGLPGLPAPEKQEALEAPKIAGQLGYTPFTPVALPDGTVAATQEDLDHYNNHKAAIQKALTETFSADPVINSYLRAQRLKELGYVPPPTNQMSEDELDAWNNLSQPQRDQITYSAQKNDKSLNQWYPTGKKGTGGRWTKAELDQMGFEPIDKKPPIDRVSHPGNMGVNGELIADGGKPFASKEEAIDVRKKAKLSDYVVANTPDGYVLSPKTDVDYQKGRQQGIKMLTSLGMKPGDIMGASQFIASKGGLSGNAKADLNFGQNENPMHGSTYLFRSNGMTLEKAAELLKQYGYTETEDHKEAIDAILNNVYNQEGRQQDAERQAAELEAQERAKEERASLYGSIAEEMGYPVYHTYEQESDALAKKAKDLGYDVTEIRLQAHEETYGQPVEEYHKRLAELLRPYIGAKTQSEINDTRTGFTTTDEERQNALELEGKTFIQAAQWLVDRAPNRFAKIIASKVLERLKGYEKAGVILKFAVESGTMRDLRLKRANGFTHTIYGQPGFPSAITLKLNGPTFLPNQASHGPGTSYSTVFHEMLHAATAMHFKFAHASDPFVQELHRIFTIVRRQLEKNRIEGKVSRIEKEFHENFNNAFKDPDELVSWGITDKEMQEFLSTIKVGEKTVFNMLTDLIRKILGLNPSYDSALDALVRTTDSILNERVEVLANGAKYKGYVFGKPEGITSEMRQGPEAATSELFQGVRQAAAKATKKAAQKIHQAGQKNAMPEGAFEGMDPDLVKAAGSVFYPENETIATKLDRLKDDFFERMAQKTVDQFRSVRNIYKSLGEDPIGYIKARLSQSIDGSLHGLLFHGHVFDDGGALNIKDNTKGLLETLKPLGKEVDRFQIWLAVNREKHLDASKRSPSLDPFRGREAEWAAGTMPDGRDRLTVYKDVQKDLNALNRSVLKVALDKGLIDQEAFDRFSKDIYYIPFYKVMENGDLGDAQVASMKSASTLTNQYFSKAIKGKSEKPFGNLMENTLKNWSHILSASMKNDAAVTILKDAERGMIVSKAKPGQETSGLVKVMEDGKATYYDVHDPMLLESITNISFMNKNSPFLDAAKRFVSALRFGVTVSPAFKVGNLFRDSVQDAALADFNVLDGFFDNWKDTQENSPAFISALAAGGVFNFGNAFEGDQATLIKKLIAQGTDPNTILSTPERIKEGLKKAFDAYEKFGNRTESVNRIALYKKLRAEGATHLQAAYQARDLLDFTMHGSMPAFRYLTQIVPFLNPRLQGLYKLSRDGLMPTSRVIYNTLTDKPIEIDDAQKAKRFAIVTGSTMAASMLLYLAFKDDDDFKKREQWDRDNFWWIKLPGMDSALRIPKPFEIGAFGTIAERTLEQIVDKDVEGKQFGDAMGRMLSNTFSFNPIPQFIKPMVDIYANKDSFTSAPIETAGMENLSKQMRRTDATSPIAIALGGLSHAVANVTGEGSELSPVQIDYAIRSYLGWLGGTAITASQYAVMPFKEGSYPDANWEDRVSLGFVKSLPSRQSSYMTAFYENNKNIQQAYADMRHYAELGQYDKVIEMQQEKGDLLGLQKVYDKTSKEIAKVRKQVRIITEDPTMTGSMKKDEIDRLTFLESELAQQAESIRLSMRR